LSYLLNAATKSPLQNDVPDLWVLFELLGFLLIKRDHMRPPGASCVSGGGFTKSRTFLDVRVI